MKAAAACRGGLFGAALAASHLSESAYATAAREHNFVTPENEMKWDAIEPTRGTFTFSPADQIVTFASERHEGQGPHAGLAHAAADVGHDLTTAADVRKAMIDHINGVMNHFKGKVTSGTWSTKR